MVRCWAPAVLVVVSLTLFSVPAYSQARQSSNRDMLLSLRDTLTGVEAALGAFNRDLQGAGSETVLARAGNVRSQCSRAIPALNHARMQLSASSRAPRTQRQASALVSAMLKVEQALTTQCERGFRDTGPGSWPDSLRAWGPHRSGVIQRSLRSYGVAADRFAAAAGFKLDPRVSGEQ